MRRLAVDAAVAGYERVRAAIAAPPSPSEAVAALNADYGAIKSQAIQPPSPRAAVARLNAEFGMAKAELAAPPSPDAAIARLNAEFAQMRTNALMKPTNEEAKAAVVAANAGFKSVLAAVRDGSTSVELVGAIAATPAKATVITNAQRTALHELNSGYESRKDQANTTLLRSTLGDTPQEDLFLAYVSDGVEGVKDVKVPDRAFWPRAVAQWKDRRAALNLVDVPPHTPAFGPAGAAGRDRANSTPGLLLSERPACGTCGSECTSASCTGAETAKENVVASLPASGLMADDNHPRVRLLLQFYKQQARRRDQASLYYTHLLT